MSSSSSLLPIYVAGPSIVTRTLSSVLDILSFSPAVWIDSHEPSAISTKMITDLPGPFARGDAPCVLDFSQSYADLPAKCVCLINHLRNHERLEWEGGLLMMLPDSRIVETVSETDLFGGLDCDDTRIRAFASSHLLLSGYQLVSDLVVGLGKLDPLRHSAWQRAVGLGHTKLIADALVNVQTSLETKSPDVKDCVKALLRHVLDCNWAAVLPTHDCGTPANEVLKRVISQSSAIPSSIRQYIDDVSLLLQLAGVFHE